MGALTESRKRGLGLGHHHRPPFLSPHDILFDLASDAALSLPPFKKPKIGTEIIGSSPPPPSTPAPPPPPPSPPEASPAMAEHAVRRFPPAALLLRPIHGPQRIIRAFGLGPLQRGPSSKVERDPGLSNLISIYLEAKKCAPFSPWQLRKCGEEDSEEDGHGRREGLRLNLYKRLVDSVQERQMAIRESPSELDHRKPTAEILDLTVETHKVTEPSGIHAVNLESTPVREERQWIKKGPIYKELYEESVKRYYSKLQRLEVELELTEKKMSSYRSADKEKENLHEHESLLPLTAEEEDEVYHALCGQKRNEVLVMHNASNIEITTEVLQCLSPNEWLNDEVINLYLELLKEREKREPKRFLKCHFFNTFFFKKLVGGKNSYDFKAVRRWTTQKKLGYSLLECDKIFVPIHKEVHWCLAVIDVRNKRFQYLDSLGAVNMKVLQVLAKYFMDEVMDKSNKKIDTLSWKQETVAGLPLQQNGWDCGMFILKYADFYSRGSSLSFSQDNMPYFRKRTVKEILRLRAE